MTSSLAARLSAIDTRIADAARRAGRDPEQITRIKRKAIAA